VSQQNEAMRAPSHSYFIILLYILLVGVYSWRNQANSHSIRHKNLTLMSSTAAPPDEPNPSERARRELNKVLPDQAKIKRGKFTITEVTKGFIRDIRSDFLPWVENTFHGMFSLPFIIKAIIGINIAVWIGWKYLPEDYMKHYFVRKYYPLDVGSKNWFMMTLFDPMWYTRITAAFSHPSLLMLIPNMFLFASMGKNLSKLLGSVNLIFLLLTSSYFSILLDEILHYGIYIFGHATKNILSRTYVPPHAVEVLGFSGVISALLVIHASSRVPTEDLSEEDIDKLQKDVRQQFLKNWVFLLLQKLLKIPLLAGFGIQIGGLLWGFFYARRLGPPDKI
jgi:membrane associated rhomboid family serine protease